MDEIDDEIQEIIHEFLVESHDMLDQLDRDLVALEQDPGSADLLGNIFRTLHTLKGSSGLFAFDQLEQIAHAGENLLTRLRDGDLALNDAITTALLRVVDAVRLLLGDIEGTGAEASRDYRDLVATLLDLQNGKIPAASAGGPAPVPVAPGAVAVPTAPGASLSAGALPPLADHGSFSPGAPADAAPADAAPADAAGKAAAKPRARKSTAKAKGATPGADAEPPASEPRDVEPADRLLELAEVIDTADASAPRLGDVLVTGGATSQTDVSLAVLRQELGDDRKVGQILVAEGAVSDEEVSAALDVQRAVRRSVAESTIRVDVDLLDSVMRLVGELVLARNQVAQRAGQIADSELNRSMQRLNHIAGDLQSGITKMRMQVIDSIWAKLPRMVRDLNMSCGKQVQLVMEGRDTELDKSILDAIKDPLTHLVRNAVDHGIEKPATRREAGKPEAGTLKLRAFHEGGQVNIEISDDGKGIDPSAIAAKAIEKGIVTAEQVAVMPPDQVTALIFRPGLSTAEKVTNVSGRGVGMDVVKTNIERVGGTVSISSVPGAGTSIRVRLPLTLAIAPALMVRCGVDRFAIPQVNVSEVVFLQDDDAGRIESFAGAPVYRLRDSLLPLVHLEAVLHTESDADEDDTRRRIVVLNSEGRQFGLVVDGVLGAQEIVVKPLGPHLRSIAVYAGATITSDGSVALILDAAELAARAHVKALAEAGLDQAAALAAGASETTKLLVTQVGDRRVAIPLATVTRMEKVEIKTVEQLGSHEALPYGDGVLHLARISHLVGSMSMGGTDREHLDVIVCNVSDHVLGMVVDKVIDVVEVPMDEASSVSVTGYTSTIRTGDHVVELLDVRRVVSDTLRVPVSAGSWGV